MASPNEERRPPEETPREGEGADSSKRNLVDSGNDFNQDPARIREQEARKAFERGWSLIPLHGKAPTQFGWQKADPATVDEVLRHARSGNLGLRTGRWSDVVVIDDDTPDGVAEQLLELPPTPTVLTGGGGSHHYFRAPDENVPNSVSKLGVKIDVRGDGGQVVFVGSVHPETGEMYRWAPGRSPDEVPLPDLPAPVLERLSPSSARLVRIPPAPAPGTQTRAYAAGALRKAVEAVSAAPEGTRNNTLNREAFSLARFLESGLLAEAEVMDQLHAAAVAAGLDDGEIDETIQSGLGSGRTASAGAPSSDRPQIQVSAGELPSIVDQAEQALACAEDNLIFQRETSLVRVLRTTEPGQRKGAERAQGSLLIWQVDPTYLRDRLTDVADWLRWDAQKKEHYKVDCPSEYPRALLARAGGWNLPVLKGVIETPTMREDGSILCEPGHDPRTGLYFDPGATRFGPVPEHPSSGQVKQAMAALHHILAEFPWIEPSDRATALAAILTSLIRRTLPSAPLFGFGAPKMGSGKSLLATVVSLIATGRPPAMLSQGKDEDEDAKRLLALLVEGDAVACIDNIDRPLGGAALCSVLTERFYKGRILGKTEMASVPTGTLWLATGNNLTFEGDLTTRVLPCDLDAKCERPEERDFDVNLKEYVPVHRGELVVAGLTLMRGYIDAGRRGVGLKTYGRFEEWSDLVRSTLVWAGEDDPCKGRLRVEASDPVRERLVGVLRAWHEAFGNRTTKVADAIAAAARRAELRDALLEVAEGRSGNLDSRRLGMWLSKHEGRIEGGRRFVRIGRNQGSTQWSVHSVER